MSAHGVEVFDAGLRALLGTAGARMLNYVDVRAAELHRRLGSHPDPDDFRPDCCRAMHAEMRGPTK